MEVAISLLLSKVVTQSNFNTSILKKMETIVNVSVIIKNISVIVCCIAILMYFRRQRKADK